MPGPDPDPAPTIIEYGPGWLVLNKPSGVSVHNDPGNDLCALVTRHLRSNADLQATVGFDNRYGLHPVHRLDRETSGIIILSCRKDVFDHMSRQMKAGTATKVYRVLVHGSVQPADQWQVWNWPLTPKSAGRRNPQGSGRRKACKTKYRVVRQSRHYSLIECRLLTGRTHQIRRHAALAGHPLVGDKRYGSLRACRYLETHHGFNRLGLHAAALSIRLPGEKTRRRFEADPIPVELTELIDKDIEAVSMDGKGGDGSA